MLNLQLTLCLCVRFYILRESFESNFLNLYDQRLMDDHLNLAECFLNFRFQLRHTNIQMLWNLAVAASIALSLLMFR